MNKKEILIVLLVIILIISIFYIIALMESKGWRCRLFHETRKIDGKEYVVVVDWLWRMKKEVYYYEQFNIFAYNTNSLRIEEFYDDGEDKPQYRKYYLENDEEKIIHYEDKKQVL